MRKALIFLIAASFFFGCRTPVPWTDFFTVKRPIPPTPTFLIFAEDPENEGQWIFEQLTEALIKKGFPVLSQTVITRKTSTLSAKRRTDEKIEEVERSIDLSQTPATYVLMVSSKTYAFKIIQTNTQEIVAKGTFSRDIPEEILIVLKDMGIPVPEVPKP